MGIILIFFWGLYIAVAVGIYFLVKRFILNKWIDRIVLVFLILLPTYDIIITNVLGAYYCNADPNPKTFIKKKVEYPESIYWEDNVYQGFNEENRKRMISNYLDGIHLKKMALNGEDGKIYVYHYENIPQEYYGLKKEYAVQTKKIIKGESNWSTATKLRTKIEKIVKTFTLKEEVYDKSSMPTINYTVTFNEIKIPKIAQKFININDSKIIDNNSTELIGYNRQCLRSWYNIMPNFSTNSLYVPMYENNDNILLYELLFEYVRYGDDGKLTLTDKHL